VSGQHGRCCTVATYPQDVHALNAQPDHMSYRPMMALTSDAWETCVHALGTCMPSCTGRPTGVSLCLKLMVHRKPQGMRWQHQSPPSREAGSRVVGHTALRSPPLQGGRIQSCRIRDASEPGEVRSYGTRDGAGALHIKKVESGATGHVIAPESTSTGR
jgi:hypothetical protein